MTYTPETVNWAAQWGRCWRCFREGLWSMGTLQIHHLVRGASRHANELCTTMMLCRECHDREHRGNGLGYVLCLGLKRQFDPEHYDRQRCNALRGRHKEAVTEAEVAANEGRG